MEFIISLNDKSLRSFLKSRAKKYHYVQLGERKEYINRLLNQRGCSEIEIGSYDDLSKEGFLQSYIDFIGKLGEKYSSIYWWATFTASKNRFISKLSPNLFVFSSLIKALEENPEKDIVVINPPAEICSSIKKYCRSNAITCKLITGPLNSILEFMKRPAEQIVNTVHFTFDSWRNIHLSKKYSMWGLCTG